MADADSVSQNVQLVRALSNEMAAYLHSLPEDVWRNAEQYASACDGWKVADVVAHLISGAMTYSLSISRALRGDTSPPLGYRPMGVADEVERIIALRTAYDEDLFPEFNATCLRLNPLLASLEPEAHDMPAWHPMSAVLISRLIEFRVLELAVHGWDIRYGLDRSAKLSPTAHRFLIDWMARWFRAGFRKTDALETPVTYRFELTEPVSESYDVIVSGNAFCLQASADHRIADVTFRCDTDTYILFGMGRLPFGRSVRRGRLSFEGDQELASQFTDWFRPI